MPNSRPIDRLGALLTASGAAALLWLPFVVLKGNRILPGVALRLQDAVPAPVAHGCVIALLLAAGVALKLQDARARLAAGLVGLIALASAAAAAGDLLTPPGDKVVRVALGSGCWLVSMRLGLLAASAAPGRRRGPAVRIRLRAAFAATAVAAGEHGTFDHLSVMREYAVNAARFRQEAGRHVALTLGSLGAALLLALPLGMLCHRVRRLRSGILASLNVVQTIPAIALFGILMAPLGALAAALPAAAKLGIAGIGAAPAVIALVLYSLLPVVANTVTGLERVSPAAVGAARVIPMPRGQVLAAVELPLALPVVLTGVRIALVQNIGLVTVAALIGAGGLGTFVFQGIGQTAIDLVLLGALPTVALAICATVLLDALIETIEEGRA